MDSATERHLETWLSGYVRDEEFSIAKSLMVERYESDPEFYDDRGWYRLFEDSGASLYLFAPAL